MTLTVEDVARDLSPVRIGLIGAGDISSVYLNTMRRSPIVDLRAIATRHPAKLATMAAANGVPVCDVASLLADPKIELVVNLTPGRVHEKINGAILAAGKHVYSEKPFALSLSAARKLADEAERRQLLIGSAPDTFYGSGQQAVRRALDEGANTPKVARAFCLALPLSRSRRGSRPSRACRRGCAAFSRALASEMSRADPKPNSNRLPRTVPMKNHDLLASRMRRYNPPPAE